MDNNQKKQLDRYSMMIVSKYFKSIGDFIKLIRICKKFKEIPEMFHYNPVKLMKKTKLFPNIETYHIYDKKEKRMKGYDKYVYWNEVTYETYLKRKENEGFKNIGFYSKDWEKYKSFKGANILKNCGLSQCVFQEIDLNGVTKLEEGSIYGNQNVEYIKLDKRISTIPDDCFGDCFLLKELDLSYVKILGNNCLYRCSSLTALTLPEVLFEIGTNCFYGLNDLEKIETKGIKLIETDMNYSLYNSFKKIGIEIKGIISYNSYDRIKYGNKIPEGVSVIGQSCFNGVTTLGDVIFPKSVTKLDRYCFDYCSLKSIDLSHVIENNCLFSYCYQLTSITLNKRIIESQENSYVPFYNNLTTLKNIELSDTNHISIVSSHLRILMDEKGYQHDKCIYTKQDSIGLNHIVPKEVKIIGQCVFYYDDEVKTVTIPSNIIEMGERNLYSMGDLERIEIQSANLRCEAYCFNSLSKIKELDLRGITSFGLYCIINCSSLTKLIIQNIPIEQGLSNCDSLKEIEIIGIENNEYEHPIDCKLAQILENKGVHCKRKIFNRYGQVKNQQSYCIPNGANEIASYAFSYCALKEISIPSSVTSINSRSFYCCDYLTHLLIEGNPDIKKSAFYCCHQLIEHQTELKQYS